MSKCEQCMIRQFNSLKALTKDELIRISHCKTTKYISKGEIIFREGESINGVYCVKEGVCKVSKLSENGRDQIITLITKGDLMGQRSLINNEVANLTAIAINDMQVCFIPKSEIIKDLNNNSDFSMEMLRDMARSLKGADDNMVSLAQKSVKKRLAETLVYVLNNFGVDDEFFLSLILSRDDYANIVGTATESAIRILSQFKKEGLIETSGKRIKIKNLKGLQSVE